MNNSDPELSQWKMSLEKEFLLECPACHYTFPDTLRIVTGETFGVVKCKRCEQYVEWKEQRKYDCKNVTVDRLMELQRHE